MKLLGKKQRSIKQDVEKLIERLEQTPTTGVQIAPNVYKVRMDITSKGRGKSGGARILTYVVTEDHEVWLLTIYDKAERENIADSSIAELVASVAALKLGPHD